MTDTFATRRYPYDWPQAAAGLAPGAAVAPHLHRFVLGLDSAPTPMTTDEMRDLNDPFAGLLAASDSPPMTARDAVAAIDALGFTRESFVVSDGGQIAWQIENADLSRQTRLVVAWSEGSELRVLLSTGTRLDDDQIFLQVIAWDGVRRQFNYFDRRRGWVWAGRSEHALREPTRGQGPFDSHVNGGLVMKELRLPWLHWSSQAAFDLPGIAPDSPFRIEPLFAERSGAEVLERRIDSGVRNWTRSRLDTELSGDTIERPDTLIRHLLTATSVNLAASAQESGTRPSGGRFHLPISAFVDSRGLLDDLQLEVDSPAPSVPWDLYQRSLAEHGYELRDEGGRMAQRGDVHFAFPAPERAFEDLVVVAELTRRRVLSERLAACLLMVDFPNPVRSRRRASLMRHVPTQSQRAAGKWDLEPRLVNAILAGADTPGTPEAEFRRYWEIEDDWQAELGRILDGFLKALQARLDTWEGFESIDRLMVSRRREMAKRPLLEFRLTLPIATLVPAVQLRMGPNAEVIEEVLDAMPVIEMFSPPGGVNDLTDENKATWSDFLSQRYFKRSKEGRPGSNDGPREQFFNPVEDDPEGPLATEVVTWTAFPRRVAISSASDAQRWRLADGSRDLQDEYCEWAITEDVNGDIERIEFTSEGPEYWQVLARLQPDTLLDLYRQLIGDHVDPAEIMPLGKYNPRNKYNNSTRNGLVHLIQGANTLGAEIELAAGASIVRRRDGTLVTDTQDLILCSKYGEAERHSDPHIGSRVNAHARDGRLVSLADPIGLFIAGCDFSAFEMPTASVQPEDCWRIERGSQERPIRVRFQAPDGETFKVSDISVDGRLVRRAGQIVDKITIGLAAWASASTNSLKVVNGCRDMAPGGGLARPSALSTIEDAFEVRR